MKRLLCLIGLHKWEINKYTIRKGKRHQIIVEEGFVRECEWCEKEQRLERPKKYHPCKYVWTNKTETK
jgi:hypothetical protein